MVNLIQSHALLLIIFASLNLKASVGMYNKRKKNRKPFISSSHTPPEHLSDAEPTTRSAATSPQHLATPEDAHTPPASLAQSSCFCL